MPEPNAVHLTGIRYSDDLAEPLILYIYDRTGHHSGPRFFRRRLRSPAEEITVYQARTWAEAAIAQGLEVRITNARDELVYHTDDGSRLVYPQDPQAFWIALAPGEKCGRHPDRDAAVELRIPCEPKETFAACEECAEPRNRRELFKWILARRAMRHATN